MAKSAGSGKPAKLSGAEKKAARVGKRARRRESIRNVRQAFTLTRQKDPKFVPYLVLSSVLAAAIVYV
ncbi:MAG: hypothetical protein QOJ78_1903, partial [Pseudonocardiales bacterium]|nr:hypothetical protein [Pseudonocardiales bacterium]